MRCTALHTLSTVSDKHAMCTPVCSKQTTVLNIRWATERDNANIYRIAANLTDLTINTTHFFFVVLLILLPLTDLCPFVEFYSHTVAIRLMPTIFSFALYIFCYSNSLICHGKHKSVLLLCHTVLRSCVTVSSMQCLKCFHLYIYIDIFAVHY